jgi:hypothetical protein
MIIAGVEFESEYLEYYYKWLEIVELKHNEEVFLLYLKDCFIIKYPYELKIFNNSELIYSFGHRIYYNDGDFDYLETLVNLGKILIQKYEDFRNTNT